jgi:hypothetical protein
MSSWLEFPQGCHPRDIEVVRYPKARFAVKNFTTIDLMHNDVCCAARLLLPACLTRILIENYYKYSLKHPSGCSHPAEQSVIVHEVYLGRTFFVCFFFLAFSFGCVCCAASRSVEEHCELKCHGTERVHHFNNQLSQRANKTFVFSYRVRKVYQLADQIVHEVCFIKLSRVFMKAKFGAML